MMCRLIFMRRRQLLVLDREAVVGEDEPAHRLDHRQFSVDPVDRPLEPR